jgi:hypothetical protein
MGQIDATEIEKRFTHHAPDAEKQVTHERCRQSYRDLANAVAETLPDSREKSLAITALEESLMWANAAIARNDPKT